MSATTQALVLVFLVLVVAILIVGQSKPKPIAVVVVSASDEHGGFADGSGKLARYSPTPVEMLAQAAPELMWIDKTVNGMKATEALAGGPVASAVEGTGEPTTTDSLIKILDDHPDARILFWGCWLVDVAFADMTLPAFLQMLDQVIDTAIARGVVPVIRGTHRFVCTGLMTKQRLDRLTAFDLELKSHCAARGVAVADMLSAPFNGEASVCGDKLHPTAEYHRDLSMAAAAVISEVAKTIRT